MDKQLLKALDNLSVGLEKLAEVLEKGGSKSGTGQALEAGDFGKSLETINTQLKSIKKDTQEILKNQQTLLAISKKKESDRKTEEVEESGGAKKEGAIKKGVTTILLIAVAVLAIGMAFKLVGKVNFLSVIGLAAAIWIMSLAFERIAKLGLSIKESAIASLTMIMMATSVTISSWILSKVAKVSFMQLFTAGAIMLMFALASDKITTTMQNLSKMGIIALIKGIVALPIVMMAVSFGITKASHILKGVTPIGFTQALTAIFIAGVFTVISYGLPKLMDAVGKISIWSILTGKVPKLALVMAAVALGITESSRYMQRIMPLSFSQAFTAILIAGMFTVISYGIVNITKALGKVTYKDMLQLPTMLALMAMGIAASAWIFFKAKPYIDGIGFMTSLRILLLGVTIGAIAIVMAFALKTMGKEVTWKQVLQLPAMYALLATAIAASAFILAKAKPYIDSLGFFTIFKILLLGVAIGVVTIVVAFTAKIMGKMSWGDVVKIPVFYTLIATAIAASAFILSKAKSSFDKMSFAMLIKIAVFGVAVAIAVAAMGLVVKLYKILGIGVKDALKGGLAIVAIAAVIMLSSLILNVGKYKNYPSLKWVLGVGAGLAAFGLAAILLGTQALNPFFYAGLGITLILAGTIVATSYILNAGKYTKYPKLKWTIMSLFSIGAFATASILLGTQVLNPFFYVGLPMLMIVAKTIVEVADILSQGKYDAKFGSWALGVVALYAAFTPIILILGAVGVAAALMSVFGGPNPFETGREMLKDIAWSIVDVSKILSLGKYVGGPTREWAEAVGIGIGAFAPVYQMLLASAIFDADIGPEDFARAIKTTAYGILAAAQILAKGTAVYKNGPPVKWAKGVGLAIGAFAPVFKFMEDFPYTGAEKIARAMRHVAWAIVEVAATLSIGGNAGLYKKGTYPSKKWGEGVGAAITAFAPAFDYMFENSSGWFDDDAGEVIDQMRYGMVQIAYAIVDVANALNGGGPYTSFPTKQWGLGIQQGIQSFLDIFNMIWDSGLSTYEFRDLSSRVADGASSMAMTAAVLYYNRKAFSVKLDPNFIKNISKNIIGFAKLAVQLDKMLVSEKTVTTTSSGLFSSSSSTKTVKERKDLSLPKDIAWQMASMARIFFWTRRYFNKSVTNAVSDWSKAVVEPSGVIHKYVKLIRFLNIFANNEDDLSLAPRIASALVSTSKIIEKGKFNQKIDPFFMRKVGQNLIDFTFVVKKIAELEGKGTSFMGRIGSAIEGAFGTDPISQTAKRMITLAKGYDAMAKSLIKLGTAMRMLNIKNLTQLGAITKGLSGQGSMPEVKTERPRNYGSVAGMGPDGKPIKKEKEKALTAEQKKKNEIYYVSQQLEKVVKLLQSIDRSTSTIDEFIAEQTKNKIMSPPPITG